MNVKKWGVVARVVGMVSKSERFSGVSKRTNKPYDMVRFSVATGKEEYELAFGREAQLLEQQALACKEGEEVAVDVRIGKRRDNADLLELVVVAIKKTDDAGADAPPAVEQQDTGGGLFSGRRKAVA